MSVFKGKIRALVNENDIEKSKLGNWISVPMQHNGKKILIINVYRIPASSAQGPRCSLTQYNVVEGKVKSATEYRKEIFKQIKQHVNKQHDIDDLIIAGDLNQNINANEIKKFFSDIGVEDVHSVINNIRKEEMDKTYVHGSNPIDTIAMSEGLLEYVEGSKLLSHNEIVNTDHRAYVVDVNLEGYFEDEMSSWDDVNHTTLNPSKKSHRIKFVNELEDQLDRHQIENIIENNPEPTHEQIEYIDNLITTMLNKAIRKVEGQRRNIPYSKEKAKRRGSIRYWKMKIRSFNGHPIDNNELNKIKTICEINDENAGIENTKIRLKEAQDEWKEMKDK